jgi:hypothetical protein
MPNIPINSGTGPNVAVDPVVSGTSTSNLQIVKIDQGASGTTGGIYTALAISGTVTAGAITTGTVSVATGTIDIATGTVTVASVATIATGTVSIINTPTITVSTGTVAVESVATIATGSVSVVNTPTMTVSTGTVDISNTPSVIATAHASVFNAFVVATTEDSTIIQTSGAHTLYITDLMVSVDVPLNVSIRSDGTQKANVYLATKGGFVFPTTTPIVLNSNQSLTLLTNTTGSCSAYAAGYTVT